MVNVKVMQTGRRIGTLQGISITPEVAELADIRDVLMCKGTATSDRLRK